MTNFRHLRTAPWEPRFSWVGDTQIAADMINLPHEDYPRRVQATRNAIDSLEAGDGLDLTNSLLLDLHRNVFGDTSHAGKWRIVQVRVGPHRPPTPDQVPVLMEELENVYEEIASIEELTNWYWDFETIHPFQDGNGRIGGIVAAWLSHRLEPDRGYLAPHQ